VRFLAYGKRSQEEAPLSTLWEILSHLAKLAPSSYVPFGDVDGVQVGISDEAKQKRIQVAAAAVCLDATVPVVVRCGELGATLLIAHRSPFSQPIQRLTGLAHMVLQQLLKRNITVYVLHYSWATVDGGLNDVLAHVLGFEVTDVFKTPIGGTVIPLGRACRVPKETTLKALIQHVAKRLEAPSVTYVGNLDDEVERLVVVAGDGITRDWLQLAWEEGYDTYLTGTLNHELATQASQLKLKVIAAPQAVTEIPGMSRLTQILRVEHPQTTFTFIDPSPSYSTFFAAGKT
jgi:dinuclear metal center YbgI/SA1388 family protein